MKGRINLLVVIFSYISSGNKITVVKKLNKRKYVYTISWDKTAGITVDLAGRKIDFKITLLKANLKLITTQ